MSPLFLTERGPIRAPWRLLLFGVVVWSFAQFALAIVTPLQLFVSEQFGTPGASELGAWETSVFDVSLWLLLAVVAASLFLTLAVERRFGGRGLVAVGLGRGSWQKRGLLIGWVAGGGAILVTAAILVGLNYLSFEIIPSVSGAGAGREWLAGALTLLLLLAPAALWEELLFRGYLWSVAEDVAEGAAGTLLALLSTSVVFGLVHLGNPGAGARTTILVALAGGCLGIVRMRYGLPAAWLAHLAWNWVMAAVLHLPVSGIVFDTQGYRAVLSGPAWLTGGNWGPEGGAVAGVVFVTALFVGFRSFCGGGGGGANELTGLSQLGRHVKT